MCDDNSEQLLNSLSTEFQNMALNSYEIHCQNLDSVGQYSISEDNSDQRYNILFHRATSFRNMVLNPKESFSQYYHQNLDLCEFSFLTLSYRTPYSYCYCTCGFEHEYFEYVNSEIGTTDLTVLRSITQNIMTGACPHAQKVPRDFLTPTSVYPMNIIAVVGSSAHVENCQRWTQASNISKICGLHPFVNAVLKNNYKILDFLRDINPPFPREPWMVQITYPIRSEDNHEIVNWETTSLLEYCAKKGYACMLRSVLKTLRPKVRLNSHVITLYYIMFEYNLKDIIHILLWKGIDYLPIGFGLNYFRHVSSMQEREFERLISAELAIVYNRLRILDYVITVSAGNMTEKEKQGLVFICVALQRQKCRNILFKHGFTENEHMSALDKHEQCVHFLDQYPCCRNEIVSFIQHTPDLLDVIRTCRDYTQFDYKTVSQKRDNNLAKVQILTALRVYVDVIQFAQSAQAIGIFRELFELWLYSNPSNLDSLSEYSLINLRLNSKIQNEQFEDWGDISHMQIEYIMDSKEHFLISEDNYLWNYTLPLLIESGYIIKPRILKELTKYSVSRQRLHPIERKYLTTCLECPRSLQLLSRDTLRRHFKTNQIHKYMSVSNVPKKLKDFILLKTVLPTLKYNERNLIF